MGLRLHNTLTRTKEDFRPIDPQNIRMYVCGPTVYDFAHIGNARPLIVFDVLFRLLRHLYGEAHVTYIRNITDVDDKINARAAEEYPNLPLNEAIREVTSKTERQFHEDVAALGCLPPTREPRATEHIAEMRAMIEKLVEKGFAYVAEDHVLFHVAAMKDYGKLSNRSLDEMIAGARVEVAPYKKDATDFVLWKPSKQEARSEATGKREGGEPSWPSPAGIKTPGRPGWHLECSAMSDRWLWQEARAGLSEAGVAHPHQFDIHGGGIDLVFPHHENEIAQSRCAFGTPAMANYWLHNGFLQVEGEKMSKSLGNFITIAELLETVKFGGRSWPGEALRLAMLKTHYRQPIDWTVGAVKESERELQSWAEFLFNSPGMYQAMHQRALGEEPNPPRELVTALEDDVNTPKALTLLRSFFADARQDRQIASINLMNSCEFLGLLRADRLAVHSRYNVRHGPKIIPTAFQDDLREFQTSVANQRAGRRMILEKKLNANGIHVFVEENGAVSYEMKSIGAYDLNRKVGLLMADRAAARKANDFKRADEIRAELDAMGVALKDSKDPATGELVTTWEVKR